MVGAWRGGSMARQWRPVGHPTRRGARRHGEQRGTKLVGVGADFTVRAPGVKLGAAAWSTRGGPYASEREGRKEH